MMDDDDNDFAISTQRSRLSSLFQGEVKRNDVNEALTFTAPKQPKKHVPESVQSSGTFHLLHVVPVHAFKLLDKYVPQGKLGCAILGIHEKATYKILMYKGKQEQVTTANININFKFHVQSDNYASFYDDNNENWSINFDSQAQLFEFAKQIALAKANSVRCSSVVVQDLSLGEGPEVESGTTVDVRYATWTLKDNTFGQAFESNQKSDSPLRIKLGRKKFNKGFCDGLVGAKQKGVRVLVVPAAMAAEGKVPAVPPNSAVIFEVLVSKVHILRSTSHSPSPAKVEEDVVERKPEITPRASFSQEEKARVRAASGSRGVKANQLIEAIMQQNSSPRHDREQIISRMAKMGTATLPFTGAVAARLDSEEEEEEEVVVVERKPEVQPSGSVSGGSRSDSPRSLPETSRHRDVVPLTQPAVKQESGTFQVSPHASQTSLYSQPVYPAQQTFMTPTTTYAPFPGQFGHPMSQFGGISDAHLSLLTAEVRSQGTEVRLSLAKISEKMDSVVQKMDDVKIDRNRHDNHHSNSSSVLDGAALATSIDRIVQENNTLKREMEERNSKIEALNKKIYDLVDRNQGFFEEKQSILEQSNDSFQAVSLQSQAKIANLENEKAKLASELSEMQSRFSALQALMLQKSSNEESRSRIEGEERTKLEQNEKEKQILAEKVSDLQQRLQELQESNSEILKRESLTVSEVESLRISNERASKEKEVYQSEKQKLESKLQGMLDAEKNQKIKFEEMQNELTKSLVWKTKYENFYEKTRLLKEKYESRIEELVADVQQARNVSPDFSGELKRVMNALYKLLQGKYEASSSYQGSFVLETTLQSIKALTFQMLERKSQAPPRSSQPAQEESANPPPAEKSPPAVSDQNGVEEVSASGDDGRVSEDKPTPENSDAAGSDVPPAETVSGDIQSAETSNDVAMELKIPESEKSRNSSPDEQLWRRTLLACLAKKCFYVIAIAYLLLWIGTWFNELEASA